MYFWRKKTFPNFTCRYNFENALWCRQRVPSTFKMKGFPPQQVSMFSLEFISIFAPQTVRLSICNSSRLCAATPQSHCPMSMSAPITPRRQTQVCRILSQFLSGRCVSPRSDARASLCCGEACMHPSRQHRRVPCYRNGIINDIMPPSHAGYPIFFTPSDKSCRAVSSGVRNQFKLVLDLLHAQFMSWTLSQTFILCGSG